MHIRKALSPTAKATSTTTTVVENENKEDEDDRILNEMEELTYAMERKKKREKKLLAKRRAKVCSLVQVSLSCYHRTCCEVIIATSLAVVPWS
jgi:hypothetical protein